MSQTTPLVPLDTDAKPFFEISVGTRRFWLPEDEFRELVYYAAGLLIGTWLAGGFSRVH